MASARSVLFGKHVKELRLHLCQTSKASQGVRDFIEKHYIDMKMGNPKLPILIRECNNIQPKLYARFELGKEASQNLSGFSSNQVLESMEAMASRY